MERCCCGTVPIESIGAHSGEVGFTVRVAGWELGFGEVDEFFFVDWFELVCWRLL